MFKKLFQWINSFFSQAKGLRSLTTPPVAPEERQKRVGLWAAGIFAIISLVFLLYSYYMVFVVPEGHLDLSDKTLDPVAGLMFIASLMSFYLIRRDRLALGSWILLLIVIIPPIPAVLVINDIFFVALLFIIVLAPILIIWVLPNSARRQAILATFTSLLAIIIIQAWNPAFRIASSGLADLTPYITVLAALAIFGFFLRQALVGSIRTKLVLAFVTITIISVGSVSLIVDRSLRTTRTNEIGDNMAVLANAEALQVGQNVQNDFNLLNGLALTSTVQDRAELGTQEDMLTQAEINQLDLQWRAADAANNNGDPLVAKVLNDPLSAELIKFQTKFPEHAEIFLTDLPGVSIATTDRTSDYLQSDEGWWQTAYKDGQYIGQPEYDASSKTLAINMAVPVRSRGSNQIIGILRTTVNINSLNNVLIAGLFGQTGRTDIYLPDGQDIKLNPTGNGKFELNVVKSDINKDLLNQNSKKYLELSLAGIPSLLSTVGVSVPGDSSQNNIINKLGWQVVVHQDQAEALKPVETQTQNDLFLAIIVTVLAAILAVGLAQVLAGPIIRLNAIAEKVAAGDLSVQAKVETNDETGTLATTFNKMVSQLSNLIGTLEQRVADRTKALVTSAQVSRRLSTLLDQRHLLVEVVEQLKSAFGYYHAHIYLLDETSGDLVMAGGTGEAGKTMLAKGHKVSKGRGLVGRAAETKDVVLVPDTTQDRAWLPNPLLPETKSEIAVPIMAGEKVLGVLDVQNNVAGSLGQEDAVLIRSVADQVAIAIQNVRQYEATQHTTEQLSEALDIAKLANWEYDVEKDQFHFNDHFYSIFHTTAEKVGGYNISSAQYAEHLVHPDDVPIVGEAIGKALASTDQHYSTQLEHRILYADGGIGYISVVVHIDRDDQGHIIRYYGANQDITERKVVEEALHKRATELELAANVSAAAATITDTDRLLQEVVDLTKQTFNLYHAHIYMLNNAGDTLELTAGAGDVGKQMVAEKRNIPLNREQSLVASAARNRQGVIANNVREEPNFLPHPLLPETRAELAVPMIVANRVVGVFDVQSDKVGYFTEDDIRIQTTLASQIAVAVQNARTFSQAQHQAKRETALNVINQKIQSATTVEAVLQIAARELGHALGAPLTVAQLGLKDNNNGGE
jgi:PAS domain S-box-containing protein